MRPGTWLRRQLSRPAELRLRTQYVLVLLGVLVVLAAAVLGAGEFFQRQAIAQERTDLNQTAQLAADQIDERITGSEAYLRGQSTRFDANLSNSARVLEQTVNNSEFVLALATNSEGEVVALRGDLANESARAEIVGSDFSDDPGVAAALDGETYVGNATREPDGSITFTITTPIHREQRLRGVVSAAVLIGAEGRSRGGGRGGDYFGPLRPLNTSTQSASVAQTNASGTLRLHSAGGTFDSAIRAQAAVDSTDWVVTVERDRAALTSQLQGLQQVQFASLLAVVLSVLVLGFYQYRTSLSQTERLLAGFDALTSGAFDRRLDFSGAREWEQIGEGFNEMAEGLAAREDTIRERERQIREREQRLSVLNRVLRHNLQNDMNVIQGYADLVAEGEDRDQRERAAQKISETASALVDHSKKARRLETVMANADRDTRVDIAREVRRIVETCAEPHPECAVEVETPEQASVSAVAGVEFGIESLVENAFEHAGGDDPEVRVTVSREGEQTHIEIRDSGPGIPEHEQSVLLQEEETSLEHGSGIGLWLAYWATVKSGGHLEFPDQTDGGVVRVSLRSAPPEDDHRGDDSRYRASDDSESGG